VAPQLLDLQPAVEEFHRQVAAGLRSARKRIPCKFLYDERGSELFERITRLKEYYLTRAETAILGRHAAEIAEIAGRERLLVEFGSGSGTKTSLVLEALAAPAAYVPIDISRPALSDTAARLAAKHPRLEVLPVCADFSEEIELPAPSRRPEGTLAFFPGSTIGNFRPREARKLLRRIRATCGPGSSLLVGVDLKKDPAILHAAYNDAAGVTAQFNRNLLARIDRELEADFDPDRFSHYAFYHPVAGRVEMHLVSAGAQEVRVAGERFAFRKGESIFTESSYKYTLEEFRRLAEGGLYQRRRVWLDAEGLFSVQLLEAT
jgi:L-histidine Nalpha-methyltransferase